MKKATVTLLTLSAVCSLLALPAFAVDTTSSTPPATVGGPPRGPHMGAAPTDIDTNKDNKISKEEFITAELSHVSDLFKQHDSNNDGLLTQDELKPQRPQQTGRGPQDGPPPGMGRPQGQGNKPTLDIAAVKACLAAAGLTPPARDQHDPDDLFAAADKNADGKLSLAELTAAATTRATEEFSRRDLNKDGFLTQTDRDLAEARHEADAKAAQACMPTKK